MLLPNALSFSRRPYARMSWRRPLCAGEAGVGGRRPCGIGIAVGCNELILVEAPSLSSLPHNRGISCFEKRNGKGPRNAILHRTTPALLAASISTLEPCTCASSTPKASGAPSQRKSRPEALLGGLKRFRESVVVGVESTYSWYWVADACRDAGIPFGPGPRHVHEGHPRCQDEERPHRRVQARQAAAWWALPSGVRVPARDAGRPRSASATHSPRSPTCRPAESHPHRRRPVQPRAPRQTRRGPKRPATCSCWSTSRTRASVALCSSTSTSSMTRRSTSKRLERDLRQLALQQDPTTVSTAEDHPRGRQDPRPGSALRDRRCDALPQRAAVRQPLPPGPTGAQLGRQAHRQPGTQDRATRT